MEALKNILTRAHRTTHNKPYSLKFLQGELWYQADKYKATRPSYVTRYIWYSFPDLMYSLTTRNTFIDFIKSYYFIKSLRHE